MYQYSHAARVVVGCVQSEPVYCNVIHPTLFYIYEYELYWVKIMYYHIKCYVLYLLYIRLSSWFKDTKEWFTSNECP
jgi:hypothetical protein